MSERTLRDRLPDRKASLDQARFLCDGREWQVAEHVPLAWGDVRETIANGDLWLVVADDDRRVTRDRLKWRDVEALRAAGQDVSPVLLRRPWQAAITAAVWVRPPAKLPVDLGGARLLPYATVSDGWIGIRTGEDLFGPDPVGVVVPATLGNGTFAGSMEPTAERLRLALGARLQARSADGFEMSITTGSIVAAVDAPSFRITVELFADVGPGDRPRTHAWADDGGGIRWKKVELEWRPEQGEPREWVVATLRGIEFRPGSEDYCP